MDSKKQKQCCELIILSLERGLNPDQNMHFNELLKDQEIRNYYLDLIELIQVLNETPWLTQSSTSTILSPSTWRLLAEYEKEAPEVEIPAVSQEAEVDKAPNEIRKVRSKVSKFSIFSLWLSSAALFFVIAYAFFLSIGRGIEVATLTDSINAKWADVVFPMEKGTRLVTGDDQWLLREGYVELLFDNEARVILEGPVEFQILAKDRIGLNYGKMYARISNEDVGFSVYTHDAKIIDLGTEFGVQAEIGGNTQVHVLKGKTILIAGKSNRKNMEISQGNAKKISGKTGEISDIKCQSDYFVRTINSKTNCAWKGQNQIDLADIVGGGNGFGTGRMESGINPVTGLMIRETINIDRSGNGKYVPVPGSSYIDGVFVPDGRNHQVLVSSRGDVFAECPVTNNIYHREIVHSKVKDNPPLWEAVISDNPMQELPVCPNIFMHANLGITFDLDAIRADFAGTDVSRFIAEAGLSPTAPTKGHVDVWVLVDGKVRYCQKGITEKGKAYPIEVKLEKTDHFLTLVSTDGGDVDYPDAKKRSTASDSAVFVRPQLELTANSTR